MISRMEPRSVVYTLGHGDRSLEDFLACLASFSIRAVADVRSYPASRAHPQFSRESLEPELTRTGFLYRWFGRELGGLRADGFPRHMTTDLYEAGVERLVDLARRETTAVVCAERDPATCHRRYLARTLTERGFDVLHIVSPGRVLLPGEGPEDQGTLFPL